MGAHLTLDDVRDTEDLSYPSEPLEGLSTAFVGFCAAFLGRQDCVAIADAGLEAVCVDNDLERMLEMRPLYPDGWQWVTADVFAYAQSRYAQGARFDVVSLDPPTNLFQRCADDVELWCSLARRVVVLGTGRGIETDTPEGWTIGTVTRRSTFAGGTYWTTLERI